MMIAILVLFCFLCNVLSFPMPQQPQELLAPANILILTPQAQVQLKPRLEYAAAPTLFHHLAPVARIHSTSDQTAIYLPAGGGGAAATSAMFAALPMRSPSSGLPAASLKQGDTNITNIVNQVVAAGQMWQGQWETLQQQLQQGLENISPQPSPPAGGGENVEITSESESINAPPPQAVPVAPLPAPTTGSTAFLSNGRQFYTLSTSPAGHPQFLGNFDYIQNPFLNPMFIVHNPLQAIRARKVSDFQPSAIHVENAAEVAGPTFILPLKPGVPTGKGTGDQGSLSVVNNEFGRFIQEPNIIEESKPSEENKIENLKADEPQNVERKVITPEVQPINDEAKPFDKEEKKSVVTAAGAPRVETEPVGNISVKKPLDTE